jgi:hypothetical protein
LRRCVQENAKKEALKREEAHARITKWAEGKAVSQSIYLRSLIVLATFLSCNIYILESAAAQ